MLETVKRERYGTSDYRQYLTSVAGLDACSIRRCNATEYYGFKVGDWRYYAVRCVSISSMSGGERRMGR